ncbi:CD48 antigen-like isoform X2 [Tachyglossus aculeatus]|uniref:CD48 antigen-like isoform X2 n=1 Tax=Tachyglossus aculeatus TaxID=9261 RepID=UPI0018F3A649|nr:CD48 antigen-like isoform X2 [Tachyglossus aculeatus]
MRNSCQGPLSSDPPGLLRAISLLLGAWIVGAQGPPMNHTRGDSVLFPLSVSVTSDLRAVEWTFVTKKQDIVELQAGPQEVLPTWIQERYKQRVHNVAGISLSLLDVTPEDSGTYEAQVKFQSGTVQKQQFTLAVYEPVPVPEIHRRPASRASAWCNVTLECRLPGAGEGAAVTVSWRRGDPPEELAAAERRGLSPDHRTLSLALPLPRPNITSFTCLARSPAQERSASIQLGDPCASPDSSTKAPDSELWDCSSRELEVHDRNITSHDPGDPRGRTVVLEKEEEEEEEEGVGRERSRRHRSLLRRAETTQPPRGLLPVGRGGPSAESRNPPSTIYSEIQRFPARPPRRKT